LSANVARAIANKFGIANRGHKVNDFAVLRLTNMPAILVEIAFINNARDANLLRYRQDEFARVIADEILRYFGLPTSGSGGGNANHIDISKGADGVVEQLMGMLEEAKMKIPFTKSELKASSTKIELQTEIDENISYSVAISPNKIGVTLEASFEYTSSITGYQRFVLSIERSLRHDKATVPLYVETSTVLDYYQLSNHTGLDEIYNFTSTRFKMPDF